MNSVPVLLDPIFISSSPRVCTTFRANGEATTQQTNSNSRNNNQGATNNNRKSSLLKSCVMQNDVTSGITFNSLSEDNFPTSSSGIETEYLDKVEYDVEPEPITEEEESAVRRIIHDDLRSTQEYSETLSPSCSFSATAEPEKKNKQSEIAINLGQVETMSCFGRRDDPRHHDNENNFLVKESAASIRLKELKDRLEMENTTLRNHLLTNNQVNRTPGPVMLPSESELVLQGHHRHQQAAAAAAALELVPTRQCPNSIFAAYNPYPYATAAATSALWGRSAAAANANKAFLDNSYLAGVRKGEISFAAKQGQSQQTMQDRQRGSSFASGETASFATMGLNQLHRAIQQGNGEPIYLPRLKFPEKLYLILDHAERLGYDDIVSFSPNGTGFRVHDRERFVKEILPHWFRQSSFASFHRQLNSYSFESVLDVDDKASFIHPQFVRGMKEKAGSIIRKQQKR